MARKNKWLEGVDPTAPASDAAAVALRARLELLWQWMPRAAEPSDEDIEHVHQLRVATRRAMAAIDIFEEYLSPRRAKWFRKRLKQVRRAAGDARDLDVLITRVRAAKSAESGACVSPALLRKLEAERQIVQEPILQVYRKLKRKHWPRRLEKLINHVGWRPPAEDHSNGAAESTFAAFAGRELRAEVERFFQAAAGDLSDLEALHRFRIEGKRLRYTIELFAGASDDALRRDLYPQIEELQEKLGAVNDHATAARRFEAWLDQSADAEMQAALRCWRDEERGSVHQAHQQFLQWWTPAHIAALHERFDQVLTTTAGVRAD